MFQHTAINNGMNTFWDWLTIEGADTGTSVMVAVFEDKALILRRGRTAPWKPGYWNLPGGQIDEGESAIQAAHRELQEEAGMNVTNVRSLGTWNMDGWQVHAFTGEAPDNHVIIRANHGIIENDQWEWVTVQDLKKYQFAVPQIADVIQRALSAPKPFQNTRV